MENNGNKIAWTFAVIIIGLAILLGWWYVASRGISIDGTPAVSTSTSASVDQASTQYNVAEIQAEFDAADAQTNLDSEIKLLEDEIDKL